MAILVATTIFLVVVCYDLTLKTLYLERRLMLLEQSRDAEEKELKGNLVDVLSDIKERLEWKTSTKRP